MQFGAFIKNTRYYDTERCDYDVYLVEERRKESRSSLSEWRGTASSEVYRVPGNVFEIFAKRISLQTPNRMFSTNSNVFSPSKPREKQASRVAKRLPCQVLMTRHKLPALPFQVSKYMDDKPFETGAGCFFHDLNFSGWCQPQRRRMSKKMLKLSETPKDFAEQLRGSPRFPEAASLVLLENRVYPEILHKGRGA